MHAREESSARDDSRGKTTGRLTPSRVSCILMVYSAHVCIGKYIQYIYEDRYRLETRRLRDKTSYQDSCHVAGIQLDRACSTTHTHPLCVVVSIRSHRRRSQKFSPLVSGLSAAMIASTAVKNDGGHCGSACVPAAYPARRTRAEG